MNDANLSDGLADALGRVVADAHKEWRKEAERAASETRAVIAELRAKVLELDVDLRAASERDRERIGLALSGIKSGANGKDADPALIAGMVKDAIAALPMPKDGRDGVVGLGGKDGEPGKPGADGVPGIAGRDGRDGMPGLAGEKGADGVNGRDGIDGALGRDGINGKDGMPGFNGKDGEPGLNGKDGLDGKDGSVGEKGAPGADGRDGEPGKDAPRVIVRGVYDRTQTYADLNIVTLDGSSWIAKVEVPTTAPGEGADWFLLSGRGKRGEKGERGGSGSQGIPGKSAPVIRGWRRDGYMAIPVLNDGTEAGALDMREFFEAYHSEAAR